MYFICLLFYMLKFILLQILLDYYLTDEKNKKINFLYFWLINEFTWILTNHIYKF